MGDDINDVPAPGTGPVIHIGDAQPVEGLDRQAKPCRRLASGQIAARWQWGTDSRCVFRNGQSNSPDLQREPIVQSKLMPDRSDHSRIVTRSTGTPIPDTRRISATGIRKAASTFQTRIRIRNGNSGILRKLKIISETVSRSLRIRRGKHCY